MRYLLILLFVVGCATEEKDICEFDNSCGIEYPAPTIMDEPAPIEKPAIKKKKKKTTIPKGGKHEKENRKTRKH